MKNGSDAFEHALRDSLEPYEVPYNSADWAQLEKELNKDRKSGWQASAGLLALLLGGTLTMATVIYFVVTRTNGTGPANEMAAVTDEPATRPEETNVLPATDTAEPAPERTGMNTTDPAPRTERANVGRQVSKGTNAGPGTNANLGTQLAEPVRHAPANPAEIAIRPSIVEGCPGASVEFAVDNLPREGTFLWNFGDGSFSRDPRPKHTFAKAGRFEVMLSHSSLGGGTIQNKPVSDVIVIHEVPEASFTMLKQEYENTIPSVHFENRSIGGHTYFWDFGDGGTSTLMVPRHVFKKSGTYTVSLVVTNSAGCTDRTERTLHIEKDYDLLAAKTFSPNGDGFEDSFIPEALKTLGVRFHMTVHNEKTGALIYETSDVQRPWNGRIGGRGEPCAAGDYIWMVEMKDGDKLGGAYNGIIRLVR